MLLASSSNNDDHEQQHDDLSVISIVGIGGMGKTTLAQLLYNDSQVQEHFQLKLWVCVSDVFDIKVLTEKILMSVTKEAAQSLEMEQLQGHLRNAIGDTNYLLVLDDVWNEDREQWLKLRALLKIGRKGSKILVTTRSKQVATIMDAVPFHELQGLSEEKSLKLFQKMAFGPGQAEHKQHLMEVGKQIVLKCANVPLAIRAVGSLLYGMDEDKWSSFKDRDLPNISDKKYGVMDILKVSYQHLRSPLKNCFAYCALFPKDYEFDKETLIDLWMAEGFIVHKNIEGQGLEEVGENYFHILLQRCFFQDIKKDEWGVIRSCKMHDIMHDVAKCVSEINCQVAKFTESSSNNDIRHLSLGYQLTPWWKTPSWMLDLKILRTFLLPEQMKDGSPFNKSTCQELTSNFRFLKVLDLHNTGFKCLPSSIGKLIHLRYINLSNTPIRKLPDSMTELQNLQTLNLYNCLNIETLPRNIKRLVNLRSLNISQCQFLMHMPLGLGELTSLQKLPRFTVNCKHSPKFKYNPAKLSELMNLNSLRGDLHIQIIGEIKHPDIEARHAELSSKQSLNMLHIEFDKRSYEDARGISHDEVVLEYLKPHRNLRQLEIYWYRGQKLPSWARMDNLCINLPNLVEIELLRCGRCEQVPYFSQLPLLKRLSLVSLESVKYMESDLDNLSSSSKAPVTGTLFFPSLQELTLVYMDNLKGWWNEVEQTSVYGNGKEASYQSGEQGLSSKFFSNLSKLWIKSCPKLVCLPMCPNMEELTVVDANKSISVSKMATTITSSSTSTLGSASKLKKLTISKVEDLKSLPTICLHQLSSLNVQDKELVSTEEIGGEVFTALCSSLCSLEFIHCEKLRSITSGLQHLTAIEKLVLWNCEQLNLSTNEELPWKYFKTLRSLQFHMIPKLVSLPSGLQHLANLRSLELTCNDELIELPEWISCFSSLGYMELYRCPKLTSLPKGLGNLKSLNQLRIEECDGLTERCRGPNGMDWPKIQHIPLVTVLKNWRES